MSENAANVARIIEYNTGGQNRETIVPEHIATIALYHSNYDGDLGNTLSEALEEGYIEEHDGEYAATEVV